MTVLPPFPAGTLPILGQVPAGLKLGAATEGDLPLLRLIYAHSRAEELAGVPWPDELRRQFLDSQFDAQHTHYVTYFPNAGFFIVSDDGESIGRLYVDRRGDDLHVIDISLLDRKQGRGLGSLLMRMLTANASQHGGGVTLQVHRFNLRAQRLYGRLGFAVVGESDSHLSMRWVS